MRTLYHDPLCPFSRAVRLVFKEKSLGFELVEERFWERRGDFLALNPAGEVPVLVESDQHVISGPLALLEYIDEAYPEMPLHGRNAYERAEIRRLLGWFGIKFQQEVTQNLLYEKYHKMLMHGHGPNPQAIRAGRINILAHLDYIGYLVAESKFLAFGRLTLADLLAAGQLSALDYIGEVPWKHNAQTKAWYLRMKNGTCFHTLLKDKVPSLAPPDHYEKQDF